jgi:cytoskeletal protein CcmA (bactofilin family)
MVEGINFLGVYSSGTAYKPGDSVTHGGNLYLAENATTGNTPPNATYWSRLASGIQYEGTFSSGGTYQKDDIVSFGGSVYIALQDTAGSNAPSSSANTAYWAKLVDGTYPAQEGLANYILKTDGTNVSWTNAPTLDDATIVDDLIVGGTTYAGNAADNFDTDAALTGARAVFDMDSSPYGQIAIHNSNTTSSTDVIAYAANGVDASGWIDMGITGEDFNQETFGITGPNDGYIFMQAPEVITKTISNKALTSNVATLTTSAVHGFRVGMPAVITGVDATFNGNYVITAVPTTTTFSYAKTNTNVASTVASGTVVAGKTGAGNLVLATGANGSENKIVFAAGGYDSGNEQMSITPDENVHIEIDTPSTSATTGALTVVGGVGVQGNMNVAGDVSIVGNLSFGGGSTSAENLVVTNPMIFAGAGNIADTQDLGLIGEYSATVTVSTATVNNKALTSNIATLTTAAAHNFLVGDRITVAGVDATFNGTYALTAVTSTTFSYAKTASNVTSAAVSPTGTADAVTRRRYAGVARDASDSKIKFFQNATTTPASTVNFAEAGVTYADVVMDDLEVDQITATGNLAVGTDKLTVNASTGAVSMSGALSVTGLSTLNGGISSSGAVTFSGATSLSGTVDVQELREQVVDVTLSSNAGTLDWSAGNIYYVGTAPTGNMTFNVTNVPADNSKIMTLNVFIVQGSTGYIPSTFQIGGSSQTIRWVGGSAPSPTSSAGKIDIFSFTMQRTSGGAWIVYASSSLNF